MRKSLCVYLALMLALCPLIVVHAQGTNVGKEKISLAAIQKDPDLYQKLAHQENYYLRIHFVSIPNADKVKQLKTQGVQLLSYLGNNTYRAKIAKNFNPNLIKNKNNFTLSKFNVKNKISNLLSNQSIPTSLLDEVGVKVVIAHNTKDEKAAIISLIQRHSGQPSEIQIHDTNLIFASLPLSALTTIAQHPLVNYIDLQQEEDLPLNHGVKTAQAIRPLQNSAFAALALTGEGVTVGVGDGGQLGEHLDFEDRVLDLAGSTYSSFGDHGDHVAGIIGSNGVINPRHQGIAPKVNLLTHKTSKITYYSPTYHEEYNMVLTNNSYGTNNNCETNGTYNYSSHLLDAQMRQIPKMLHVFAAGNSGRATCGDYPQGFKTVLRYYQSAKNVLTVGNVDKNLILNESSSKGPVLDGRIKPEIVGIGSNVYSTGRAYNYRKKSGTSMATPAVTGTLALLNQAYRNVNNNRLPDGGLLKAIACNTALDLGNPGPDYSYGFGLIQGLPAVEAIEANAFYSDEIVHGEIQSSTIEVAPEQSILKVLLYWHDKEAENYSGKVLINDLNLEIVDPNGNVVLPWVLNPDANAVDQNATRGIDTLNNIEQISIDNPIAGSYTIRVSGSAIPQGPQKYYVTYHTRNQDIRLLYPNGNEVLESGNKELITWDAPSNYSGTFTVEYSNDNGNTWEVLAADLSAFSRNYTWTVPQTLTQAAKIRVRGTANEIAEHNLAFSIKGKPSNFSIEALCDGIILMNWEGNWQSYQVSYLHENEWIALDTISENQILINDSRFIIDSSYWFIVEGIEGDGNKTPRTLAKNCVPTEFGNCPWEYDLALTDIEYNKLGRQHTSSGLSDSEDLKITLLNQGLQDARDVQVCYQINGQDIVRETLPHNLAAGASISYNFSQKMDLSAPMTYRIDAWIEMAEDTHSANDSILNLHTATQLWNDPIDLTSTQVREDFNSANETVYQLEKMGLNGIQQWDYYNTTQEGQLEINSHDRYIHLIPTDEKLSIEYQNNVIWTLNLSEVNPSKGDILLSFEYQNNALEALSESNGKLNQILVRGSDSDEWKELMLIPKGDREWVQVKDENISEVLYDAHQNFSSSFQIMFNQQSETGFSVDNIEITQSSILPVALNEFSAKALGEDVLLEWSTSTELNNDYFNIELAIGDEAVQNNAFEKIGQVNGMGTTTEESNYQFLDKAANKKGHRYYRLQQVDYNGAYTYSNIQMVSFPADYQVNIYPNPFSSLLKIQYQSQYTSDINIQLTDVNGMVVHQMKCRTTDGRQVIDFPIPSDLASGNYYLVIPEDKLFPKTQVLKINR